MIYSEIIICCWYTATFDNLTTSVSFLEIWIAHLTWDFALYSINYRDVVYKHGIRTTDFFKDYDKHHNGIITENQVG